MNVIFQNKNRIVSNDNIVPKAKSLVRSMSSFVSSSHQVSFQTFEIQQNPLTRKTNGMKGNAPLCESAGLIDRGFLRLNLLSSLHFRWETFSLICLVGNFRF